MEKTKFMVSFLVLVAAVSIIGTGCAPRQPVEEQPMMNEQQETQPTEQPAEQPTEQPAQ
jgi:hypothetical protein